MNTPLQLLEQDLVPSLPIHPITTCSSMLVLDMMQPILPPSSKRRNVYTAAGAKALNAIEEPTRHTSIMTLTQSDNFYHIQQAKQGKPSSTPLSSFREITPEIQLPLQPKNLSKIRWPCICPCRTL